MLGVTMRARRIRASSSWETMAARTVLSFFGQFFRHVTHVTELSLARPCLSSTTGRHFLVLADCENVRRPRVSLVLLPLSPQAYGKVIAVRSAVRRDVFRLDSGSLRLILGPRQTSPVARSIRRHHDRHGRHCRLRYFHQPLRGCPPRAHSVFDSGRLAPGRRPCPARRVHLGGTCISLARRGWTIPLLARGLSSVGRVPLWMGPSSGNADRRDGGSGGHVQPV